MDEGSATVAKDALHNYKLDGENKIKVMFLIGIPNIADVSTIRSRLRGSECHAEQDDCDSIRRGYYYTMYFSP